MTTPDIARVCHQVNKAYCEAMGDPSQVDWEDTPDWQKKSVISGVEYIIANQGATPEESHASWLKYKEAEGWTWGPVKDPEKKEHPNMLPYSGLPPEQRLKDHIFGVIVRTLMEDKDIVW